MIYETRSARIKFQFMPTALSGFVWAAVILFLTSACTLFSEGVTANGYDRALAERAYNKCIVCHSLEEGNHEAGPSLHGLKGRKAGEVSGFKFSKAMRTSGVIWDRDTLNAF